MLSRMLPAYAFGSRQRSGARLTKMRFFIVGSGRCGSRLLTRMLNEHPDLFVIDERHWIPKLYEFFGSGRAPVCEMLDIVERTRHVDASRTTPLSAALSSELRSIGGLVTVREFADELSWRLADRTGKTIWADKTPDYFGSMEVLQRIWPDTRFVHLIRNGAHVARSMASHTGYRALLDRHEIAWTSLAHGAEDACSGLQPPDTDACLRLWRLHVERARDEAARLSAGSYFEMRSEALLENPRRRPEELCGFVSLAGVPSSWVDRAATMVDPDRASLRNPHLVTDRTDAAAVALMHTLGYADGLRWDTNPRD